MKKVKFMDWPFLIFLFFAVIGPVGTKVYAIYNHVLYNNAFLWLDVQPRIDAQESTDVFVDGKSMQEPVEGTVARDVGSQEFLNVFTEDEKGEFYSNPLTVTKESLELGKKEYEVYCLMCHGAEGKGGETGTLNPGHFAPPSFHSSTMKAASDGYIYNLIVKGRNTMPSYAKQLSEERRWAIVQYVRVLQRAKDAQKSDLNKKLTTTVATSEEAPKEEGHH